MVTKLLAKATV